MKLLRLIIIFLTLEGCATLPFNMDSEASKFISGPSSNKNVIVFVHGVGGDNVTTWTNNETKAYFPKLLADNKKDYDVFVGSYYALDNARDSNIFQLADRLDKVLVENGIFPKSNDPKIKSSYDKVYFVAHSMGNLVIRTLLAKRQFKPQQLEVPLIVSFASPSKGSQLANFASNVEQIPQLEDMKELPTNSYLSLLNLLWKAFPYDTEIACAYEKKPVGIALVVPKDSATEVCTRPDTKGLEEDHFSIVKPENVNSKSFQWLVEQINKDSIKKGWEETRWKNSEIIVAAKDYPESNIHAAMISLILKEYVPNIRVITRYQEGDGAHVYNELKNKTIDIYPEYSGSILFSYLGLDPLIFNESYDSDKKIIEKQHHIEELNQRLNDSGLQMMFFPQYGFNSPFQLVMLKPIAQQFHIIQGDGTVKLSDLAKFSSQCDIAGETGFFYRNDGYRGLIQAYANENLNFRDIRYYKHVDSYNALDDWGKRKSCLVAVGYGTDSELHDQAVVEKYVKVIDDKGFFPIHYPGSLAHGFLDKEFPDIKNALTKLENIISSKEMADLNGCGNSIWEKKHGKDRDSEIEDLARYFLLKKGIIQSKDIKVKMPCLNI